MKDSVLYVCRYPFAPCNRKRQPWRLVWAKPGDTSYFCAEGECSAKYFETMAGAIAYGKRHYGYTAKKWIWGNDFT
jgi:hypothetical protein